MNVSRLSEYYDVSGGADGVVRPNRYVGGSPTPLVRDNSVWRIDYDGGSPRHDKSVALLCLM